MKRRVVIVAAIAALGFAALSAPALARDCGGRCAALAEYRPGPDDYDRGRRRPPELRGPGRDAYGGAPGERFRSLPLNSPGARDPLPDRQIWAIAQSRVPGRIVNARLHGTAYSFRIISNRGNVVDLVVDRYSGRVVSINGGP